MVPLYIQIVSAATTICVCVSGNVACFITRCVIIKPMHAPVIDGFKMGNSTVTIKLNEEEQVKVALTQIIY